MKGNNNILIGLEEYATDSFENVLFSICRFYELVGNYPKRITIIGFDFKEKRFTNLIHDALKLNTNIHFQYIGIKPAISSYDPPPPSLSSVSMQHIVAHNINPDRKINHDNIFFNYQNAVNGELVVYNQLQNDIYGCFDSNLASKKISRNPFQRFPPYKLSCNELNGLLNWCGPELYSGKLPWD